MKITGIILNISMGQILKGRSQDLLLCGSGDGTRTSRMLSTSSTTLLTDSFASGPGNSSGSHSVFLGSAAAAAAPGNPNCASSWGQKLGGGPAVSAVVTNSPGDQSTPKV